MILPVLILIGMYSMHMSSCASTKEVPDGGPKDTIPPVVVSVYPDSNSTNVPVNKSRIELNFNEYIQLKDVEKNIILSPPQKEKPKTKIRGKSLIITFPHQLDSSKTYSLNFGQAISDNNEGNILYNYSYSFSTGKTLDSMLISGTVVDYATLEPLEGITIALYAQPKDSSVFNTLPDAAAISDKWGYFCVRNLKPVPYKIYSFKDENGNSMYDPGIEKIGFIGKMVTPETVMKKGIPQLAGYDMKDTASCLARKSEFTVYMFREKPSRQFISNYGRTDLRACFIKFNAGEAQIDSFSIKGIRNSRIIRQFNATHDSMCFWINDQGKIADTLFLGIKYKKTDSLGNLASMREDLKFIVPYDKKIDKRTLERNRLREKRKNAAYKNQKTYTQSLSEIKDKKGRNSENTYNENLGKIKPKDKPKRKDLLEFTLNTKPSEIEQNGFVFTFPFPLVKAEFDSIRLTMSTPRHIVSKMDFGVAQDSTEIRRYSMFPNEQFRKGNDYILIIPKAAFRDINGYTNDSTYKKVSLPIDDKLSSITLEVSGTDSTRYIIDLVNEKKNKLYRSYTISRDSVLVFPYLNKGNYSVRITQDSNGNGMLDPGCVLSGKQPEKARMLKLKGGSSIIKLEERMDITQTVDLEKMFASDGNN
jgi:uncharacterized protein (DUF2141 family)